MPGKPQLPTVAATVALALLAWRFDQIVPGIDGDWSWVAGLAIMANEGYRFGDEMAWSYGPLGFLNLGPLIYYGHIAGVVFIYQTVLQLLLAATLYVAARRSYPAPIAFAIAFVVLALTVDRALLLGFAWCVLALTRADDDAPRDALTRWLPAGIGVLAGILVLAKINQGVAIVAIATATLLTRPGRSPKDAATFTVALLTTAAVGWLATGQALGDVWPYVRYGAEIVGGYPATMGVSDPDGQWQYLAALLVFALGSALVWNAARRAGPTRRWGLVAVWLIFSFATFKQGFVRQDVGHVLLYVTGMLMALAILPVSPRRGWRGLAGAGIVGCVVLYGAVGQSSSLGDRLDPVENAQSAMNQAATLLASGERARRRRELAEAIRDHYALPPEISKRIGGRAVAFWPYGAGELAYALALDWRPLPVIEPYAIYTPALDDMAAKMLASTRAPDRIVRRPRPVSAVATSLERVQAPLLEPPLTTRAIFCRYRELVRSGAWELLASGPDRCGRPRKIRSVVAAWGDEIEAPRPRAGTAILVRIDGSEPSGTERLKALWLRPDARMILLDGRLNRLVPSTATSGHLIRAAPDVDHPPPLAMAPNAERIAVRRVGDQPDSKLRYTFLELPVERQTDPEGGEK